MIIAVVVSMEGTLKEALARVEYALRSAKKLIKAPMTSIAASGPRMGISEGKLTSLQYRLTNQESHDRKELWNRAPDEVLRVGAGYGKTLR